MTIANGSRHSMAYVAETVYGTTPTTPVFKAIRHTGTTLALNKSTYASAELRADRQITDMRHGTKKIGGDISCEFSGGAFDDFLQAAMGGTWGSLATIAVATISASSTDNSFNDSANGFITAGFAAGDVVTTTGFTNSANNSTLGVVVSVTAGKMIISGITLVTEAAAAGHSITSNAEPLTAGTIRRSFTVERNFADIGQYLRYTGVEFDGFDIDVKAEGIVPIKFTVLGQDQASATTPIAGATYPAAPTNRPYDGFSGSIKEGGSVIAVLTEVKLTLKNNLSEIYVVGSNKTLEPAIGKSTVTGSVTAYFQDTAMLNKFVNETESSIEFTLTDGTNSYDILIPRVKYTGAPPNVSNDKPITLAMPFSALLDSVTGTNLRITKAP